MRLSSRDTIEAPIDAVFAALTDIPALERQAIARGAKVERVQGQGPLTAGSAWTADFRFRGRSRSVKVEVPEVDAPSGLQVELFGSGFESTVTVDLAALTPQRTRISTVLKVRPKTLSTRLLVQSAKLTRSKVETRFRNSTADFAKALARRIA